MVTKKQVYAWIKSIEKHKKAVAKVRDDLDDAISEMSQLEQNCEEAFDNLDRARDSLSELV